ncbi:hypothetical protein LTR36_000202 [Oleoguttula mirabilis]|uniref:Apc15p protein-domain-containing protein n=1 Tax=Oleoguttula mirabilis TaxID=1507867 RepID=A0AAV9JXW0_9PEZI|nr:hypothetical protein LTR36_000202 [Oleoguttula mirabilis]
MFSLPLLPPQEDPSPFLRTHFRPRAESPPSAAINQNNAHAHAHHRQPNHRHRDEAERKAHNTRSPLVLLAADEAAIAQRKAAIRNFGAYWIRPPGVSKTLQAMSEEEAERLEQEEMARQERGLLDLQAQQQLQEARERATDAAAEADDAAEAGEERNLDDDIPEAGEATADLSFNEESMMEGSSQLVVHEVAEDEREMDDGVDYALEMEEAGLTGAARDEEELGIEHDRDLDDSVPEAGSYQHTDTEAEDTESDSELQDSFAVQSTRRSVRAERNTVQGNPLHASVQGMPSLQERMRAQVGAADALPRSPGSLHLSSSLLESSFVGSSPVLQRGAHGARGRGAAGRRRRGPAS